MATTSRLSRCAVPGRHADVRSTSPPATRPDILFIVIDAWRFDTLRPDVTPNIWRFGQGAARFTEHFSGGNATRAGIFSLFYGVPATYWHHMLQQHRGPELVSALSRKTHTGVGDFDVPLPLNEASATVEPRTGGPPGTFGDADLAVGAGTPTGAAALW